MQGSSISISFNSYYGEVERKKYGNAEKKRIGSGKVRPDNRIRQLHTGKGEYRRGYQEKKPGTKSTDHEGRTII